VLGRAHVVNGDTFRLGDRTIRLSGIDAPEARQTCDGVPGLRECGVVAAEQLRRRIESREVACDVEGRDDYDRLIATCLIGGRDLSEWMVRDGWALAFVRYSTRYQAAEAQAKASRLGIWQTSFEPPWDYRAGRWRTDTASAPDACPIKGNISAKGERIYHTPWGSRWYAKTVIDASKGERWFCSEREALDAGWRASKT
jgi:endonuclease YncB( thermonuclease family)